FTVVGTLKAEVSLSTNYNGGNSYTFIAEPKNGGVNPKFNWYVNGKLLPDETGQSYTAVDLQPWDKVTVSMLSSRDCAEPRLATSEAATTSVSGLANEINGLVLAPNPNKGSFTISAQGIGSDKATIYITNTLGQQ